jgi:iron complex outermembrane receptor protein
LAFEVGYRLEPNKHTSLDIATFWDRYHHLQSLEPGASFWEIDPAPIHFVAPRYYRNLLHGQSYGGESTFVWKVTTAWKLNLNYTFLRLELTPDPQSLSLTAENAEGDIPRHQFSFRSQWDLPRHFEFDQSVYYVGLLNSQSVSSYVRGDARLGWRSGEHFELSVVGQNLLSPRRVEFVRSQSAVTTLDKRKAYLKLSWTF